MTIDTIKTTSTPAPSPTGLERLRTACNDVFDFLHGSVSHVLTLGVRLYMGWIFFLSGWLSLSPWDSAVFLYEYEYMPNITKNLGFDISFISPTFMAFMGTAGELVFASLLWLGLGTRLAAVGLLAITAVIQLTYPEHGNTHYAWMLILGLLIVRGGGALSLDHILGPKLGFKKR